MFTAMRMLAALLLAAGLGSPALASGNDMVLVNGHIYTGDAANPWASSMAVAHGRIIAVGAHGAVLGKRPARAQVIDLHRRTVIPGIVDAHVHLLYGAMALHGLNLSTQAQSITPDKADELVRRLTLYAAAHPHDAVLFGRADFSTVPPTTPTAALLDRASPVRPMIIHNSYEHALWLNSAALKMAGITDRPVADADEERGVVRDASGNATGVLTEAGMQLAARAVAKHVSVDEQLAMVQAATRYLNSFGVTSVVNATGSPAELQLYATLRDRGTLTVRTRTAFGSVAVRHKLTPQFLDDLNRARESYHDDWVSADLIKFFVDGGTGLVPPLVYTAQDYAALVSELDRRGYQIMTHALRADSVHMVLDAYERLEKANGPRDRRLRIEHADLVQPADIPRFAGLSVIASMQPTFCCAQTGGSFDPADPIVSDRWHALAQSGALLAFGSDWPCTWPPNPFVAIQEAATRQAWQSPDTAGVPGVPLDGAGQGGAHLTGQVYAPEERINVVQAVDAYTRGAAYAAFADDRVGSLKVGKLADFAVLSQDIFAIAPERIGETQVVMTVVGGTIVFATERGATRNVGQ